MVLFYLTNTALDIASGTLWWLTKNTIYGIYYGGKYMIYGHEAPLAIGSKEDDIKKHLILLHEKLDMINAK
jgi:hypothetical protein